MSNKDEEGMKKIIVSFSGGHTSAYMTKLLIDKYGKENIRCVFANTGSEHPDTLRFVNECDELWGLDLVWVEAKVNHGGTGRGYGTKYMVVDYESCSVNGEPFEDVIVKYGLPNTKYLHCTRELKERPITAWIKDNFQKGEYELAIGLRSDEMDRVNLVHKVTRSIIYPLLDMGKVIEDVNTFWKDKPYKLAIPSYMGNCVTCHKKTDRKLFTIAKEDRNWFRFMERMEREHRYTKSSHENGRRVYRKNRSARDIIWQAQTLLFDPWVDDVTYLPDPTGESDLDYGGSCGESCEVFSD